MVHKNNTASKAFDTQMENKKLYGAILEGDKMKRYNFHDLILDKESDVEYYRCDETLNDLEIVYKSLIAKDYIAAIVILSEILEGE